MSSLHTLLNVYGTLYPVPFILCVLPDAGLSGESTTISATVTTTTSDGGLY